ncbi:MAG: 6-bladed beta-propeller [Candidatus Saccharicenans sp.]
MLKRLLLCHIFSFLILHNLIYAESHKKIVMEEVLAIGGLENDLLYQWSDLTVDDKDLIYVLDVKDFSLKLFDPQGNLIKKTGRKGEGPGEFNFPVKINCYGDRLYVSELYRPGIKVFTKDLNYVSTIITNINRPILDFQVQQGRIVAALLNSPAEPAALIEYDLDGREKSKIQFETKEHSPAETQLKEFYLKAICFKIDKNGNIIIAYEFVDKIIKIDPTGHVIFKKSFFDSKTAPFKNSLPQDHVYVDVETDKFNNIFILCGKYSSHPKQDIIVLTEKGDYLTTLTLPEPTHMIYIDHNNFLYARADEGMTIKKYKLTYSN